MHESHLTTQDVLDDKTFEQALNEFRPHPADRNDSFQTEENTRRNSMQQGANLPPSHIHSPLQLIDVPVEPCQRCSGEGNVNKPCGFCKATGKASKTISCVDCHAEKNGCGNMNCKPSAITISDSNMLTSMSRRYMSRSWPYSARAQVHQL